MSRPVDRRKAAARATEADDNRRDQQVTKMAGDPLNESIASALKKPDYVGEDKATSRTTDVKLNIDGPAYTDDSTQRLNSRRAPN